MSTIHLCSFDEEILHVFGSLMENHTGSIQWLKMNLEDTSHSGRFFVLTYNFYGLGIFLCFVRNCIKIITGVQRRRETLRENQKS